MKIKITLRQLEILLQQQKEIVSAHIAGNSYQYNTESTDGHLKTLPIDKDKMKRVGMSASFPDDFCVLKNYIQDTE